MNLKKEKKNSNFALEFMSIIGIPPSHLTNRVEERCIQKDMIFDFLAEKVFDNPRLLDLLMIKMRHWLKRHDSELIYALAGYLHYFNNHFRKAEKFFLKSINVNPNNLDNWLNLAFSLYHQDEMRHRLGKKILFNFDYCVKYFKKQKIDIENLKSALRDF